MSVGFLWNDASLREISLVLALEQPKHIEMIVVMTSFGLGGFYDFKVNDSVTVTPAIFVIEKDGKKTLMEL